MQDNSKNTDGKVNTTERTETKQTSFLKLAKVTSSSVYTCVVNSTLYPLSEPQTSTLILDVFGRFI